MYITINKHKFDKIHRTILVLADALDGAASEVLDLESHLTKDLGDKVNNLGSSLQCYSLLVERLGGDIEDVQLWIEAKGINETHKILDLTEELLARDKL